jgi:mono/diheme cytochrome c family protein
MKFDRSVAVVALFLALGCNKLPDIPLGVGGGPGPSSIAVPANLAELVAKADVRQGEALYVSKGCKACHTTTEARLVGPGLRGELTRRELNWAARMILRPDVMVKEDPEAKRLFVAYMTPMANQNVTSQAELPALLAYIKSL